jgi:hypothetical protein
MRRLLINEVLQAITERTKRNLAKIVINILAE